jgi:tetratricopeptide (TPR) repeat protein
MLTLSVYLGNVYSKKAMAYKKRGDYTLAVTALDRAIFFDRDNAEHHIEMGDLMLTMSSMADSNSVKEHYLMKSLKYYDDATELCSVCGLFYTKKGLAMQRAKHNKEAEESLKRALFNAPNDVFVIHGLASFYLELDLFDEAFKWYRKMLSLDSNSYRFVFDEIWGRKQGYEFIRRAVPDIAGMRKKLAYFLMEKGASEEGLKELEYAFLLEPSVVNAVEHLKGVCRIHGCGRALEISEGYSVKFGNEFLFQKQLAQMHVESGDIKEAAVLYNKIINENDVDISIYLKLAGLYMKAGLYSDDMDTLRKAVKKSPDDTRVYRAFSYRCRMKRLYPDALNILNDLKDLKPNEPELYLYISDCYRNMGDKYGALGAIKSAIAIRPGNATYRYRAGQIYYQIGLHQEAAEQLKICLEIKPDHKYCKRVLSTIQGGGSR